MAERYVTVGKREDGEGFSPRGQFNPRPQYDTQKTIYVGQLRYDTEERTVRKWFEAYGPVAQVKLIFDKETGRSKGFGFVTFEDERDARDALNDAGGRDLDGAAIKVNISHGGGGPMGFGGRGRGRGPFPGGRGYGYRGGGRGYDRRVMDDRYSPGRYSPRSRSRSRSPSGRKHDRDERYDDEDHDGKRRREDSPSRSRSRASRSPSRSPSRSSRSRSRSASPARPEERSPVPVDHHQPAPHTSNEPAHAPPPAASKPAAPAAAPTPPGADQTPPGMGAVMAATAGGHLRGAKPPPSAEAVKKELLRLRRQEQDLGNRLRSMEGELAEREQQLADRDRALAAARRQLAVVTPQLEQYKEWLAALLDGAAQLASSRRAVSQAEAEATRREEALATLRSDIAAEAERMGAELANGGDHPGLEGHDDDDEAWEQLAADIQKSEREAAEAHARGAGGRAPSAQGASDTLQAAMQEAAMEGNDEE